jgi:hypothetical protein
MRRDNPSTATRLLAIVIALSAFCPGASARVRRDYTLARPAPARAALRDTALGGRQRLAEAHFAPHLRRHHPPSNVWTAAILGRRSSPVDPIRAAGGRSPSPIHPYASVSLSPNPDRGPPSDR